MATAHWLYGHPVAWVNPVELRASAALPAAGAWDAAPTEQNVAGASSVTLYFTYTEDAQGGGGAFDWQLWASAYAVAANVPAGAEEWTCESVLSSGAVAGGADTQSLVQREYQTYEATSGDAEAFAFGPIALDGVERIRVRARESAEGDQGNPGTLQITAECQP